MALNNIIKVLTTDQDVELDGQKVSVHLAGLSLHQLSKCVIVPRYKTDYHSGDVIQYVDEVLLVVSTGTSILALDFVLSTSKYVQFSAVSFWQKLSQHAANQPWFPAALPLTYNNTEHSKIVEKISNPLQLNTGSAWVDVPFDKLNDHIPVDRFLCSDWRIKPVWKPLYGMMVRQVDNGVGLVTHECDSGCIVYYTLKECIYEDVLSKLTEWKWPNEKEWHAP